MNLVKTLDTYKKRVNDTVNSPSFAGACLGQIFGALRNPNYTSRFITDPALYGAFVDFLVASSQIPHFDKEVLKE
ncbi:hypothetical protein JXA85_01175, partial [Candidatus Woesearchaeota archaeon]|nr:hypothetical protein [Candidatus Woesearchaeota archaeon]